MEAWMGPKTTAPTPVSWHEGCTVCSSYIRPSKSKKKKKHYERRANNPHYELTFLFPTKTIWNVWIQCGSDGDKAIFIPYLVSSFCAFLVLLCYGKCFYRCFRSLTSLYPLFVLLIYLIFCLGVEQMTSFPVEVYEKWSYEHKKT